MINLNVRVIYTYHAFYVKQMLKGIIQHVDPRVVFLYWIQIQFGEEKSYCCFFVSELYLGKRGTLFALAYLIDFS